MRRFCFYSRFLVTHTHCSSGGHSLLSGLVELLERQVDDDAADPRADEEKSVGLESAQVGHATPAVIIPTDNN